MKTRDILAGLLRMTAYCHYQGTCEDIFLFNQSGDNKHRNTHRDLDIMTMGALHAVVVTMNLKGGMIALLPSDI